MRWLEISGAPGTGKSTIADPLWAPHSVVWNGEEALPEWAGFIACTKRLLDRVKDHPSYHACVSMTDRSIRKMSAVARANDRRIYIQTGFAQRGLGIGWRLKNPEEIAEYFELMPVSVGVAFLYADVGTVCRRNVQRGKDRSYMVQLMERPREIATRVLRERGVAVLELDTRNPVVENRERLVQFSGQPASASHATAA